jgi:hypothetical protein
MFCKVFVKWMNKEVVNGLISNISKYKPNEDSEVVSDNIQGTLYKGNGS